MANRYFFCVELFTAALVLRTCSQAQRPSLSLLFDCCEQMFALSNLQTKGKCAYSSFKRPETASFTREEGFDTQHFSFM